MKKISMLIAVVFIFGALSCGDSEEFSVSVLMKDTGISNGVYGYVKLVAANGNCTDTALYWGREAFNTEQALVTIENVKSDTYFACVFVDDAIPAAAGDITSSPDTGDDWYDTAVNIDVKDDIYITVEEADWSSYL